MRTRHSCAGLWASVVAAMAVAACSVQAPYIAKPMAAPVAWSSNNAIADARANPADDSWWARLRDPGIDTLVRAAMANSPSLAQAVARIDEARATLGASDAQRGPTMGATAGITRSRALNSSGGAGDSTIVATSAQAGPNLSWELDLFGRLRQSVDAARYRLDARTADAAGARLALAADVADTVLMLRACEWSRQTQQADIASRSRGLALTRLKVATGFAAPVDESRSVSGVASARTALEAQAEQCARDLNALVALTGVDAEAVRKATANPAHPELVGLERIAALRDSVMPEPPRVTLALPATVLMTQPTVVAAQREEAAAWSDIGVARADRLPRIDLAAALTGQWLSALGSSFRYTAWSLGPTVSATVFDNGRGAANVDGAEARYREAVATLNARVRTAAQDVENALAAVASAKARTASTQEGAAAAFATLLATEAQWRAGSVSLFELEDARRQSASAQDSLITAARDRGRAWIALVRATGNAIEPAVEAPHDKS